MLFFVISFFVAISTIYAFNQNLHSKVRVTTFYLNQLRLQSFPSDTLSNSADSWSAPPADYVYTYTPPEVGIEIWIGSIVALIPIIWATIEFTSRIQIQRRCLVCNGSGLVYVTKSGNSLTRPRKCWSCGGFLPWIGWKAFFFSSLFDVGNGGVLQRPSKDYEANNQKVLMQQNKQLNEIAKSIDENKNE